MYDAALLTASSPGYYPGLLTLLASLGGELPALCLDCGLTAHQRVHLRGRGVRLLHPNPRVRGASPAETAYWQKPFAVLQAARWCRRVAWVDSDAVLLASPRGLLDLARAGPVFTPDAASGAAVANPADFYRHVPVEPTPANRRLVKRLHLNAGVFALDLRRDRDLVADWASLAVRCLRERLPVRHHDQGALLATVIRRGLADAVRPSCAWNTPAVPGAYPERRFFACVRRDHPGAKIVHWMGARKYWLDWPPQSRDVTA